MAHVMSLVLLALYFSGGTAGNGEDTSLQGDHNGKANDGIAILETGILHSNYMSNARNQQRVLNPKPQT